MCLKKPKINSDYIISIIPGKNLMQAHYTFTQYDDVIARTVSFPFSFLKGKFYALSSPIRRLAP